MIGFLWVMSSEADYGSSRNMPSAAQRSPSVAARDQHASLREQDYLRTMLSRRQLQGFVMRRGPDIAVELVILSALVSGHVGVELIEYGD